MFAGDLDSNPYDCVASSPTEPSSRSQNVNKKDLYICLHVYMYTACVPGAYEVKRVYHLPWNWVIDYYKLVFFFFFDCWDPNPDPAGATSAFNC